MAAPQPADGERITQVFDLIGKYAIQRKWTPIGWREFKVGPWTITVNGTKQERDGLAPFHARIVHDSVVSIMVVHPYGGTVGGWMDAERNFINDMERELSRAE